MFNKYYQQELNALRELGAEFSRAHPALAPMLSGPAADPDVERLLEGVAFLTGLLRQKLDDEFPEIIHDLMQVLWPHYLRPVPATTVVAFSPKPTLKQSLTVPAGIHIGSVPVEGTTCHFRTAYEVEVHPLALLDASLARAPGKPAAVKLLFELSGINLSDWEPKGVRFFLAGDPSAASDLYLILRKHLRRILITPVEKGASAELLPDALVPVGFGEKEALIPYPTHSFPGYRILQEYFVAPAKFLFFELTGWERWSKRGEGNRFEVKFELGELDVTPPKVGKESFALFATPAANVFPHDADPILLDHKRAEYLVRPTGSNVSHYQIFSVDQAIGFVHGTAKERKYVPNELFNPDLRSVPVYHTTKRPSVSGAGFDTYLSVAYPGDADPPDSETLSIRLTCTNGTLPESLRVGDISEAAYDTPEYVEFRNITPATYSVAPPLGTNLPWRLISHLSLNYLSLARAENLRALLELYLFPDSRDRVSLAASKKRIAGIQGIEAKPSDRLVGGLPMRGQEIEIRLRQDHFAGPGDLYLFGCVLDHFLGNYASINTFTRFTIQETLKGDVTRWPVRIGNHPLL
jgi:type VI secretion system protein ImpG